MKKLVLPALLSLVLAACSSTGTDTASQVEDRSAGAGVTTVTAGGTSGSGIAALTDPNNILSKRSVYFDFDSSAVKGEYRPVVEAHAQYLKQNTARKAQIQGNTDARGSREYNLALGQRRSESVKQAMRVLGVPEAQLEAVSFGKEKPAAQGSDEAAMAQNRRAEVSYR